MTQILRRVLLCFFILCGVTGGLTVYGQVGVSLGFNFDKISDVQVGSRTAAFENRLGWHAELWFDVPLGPIALRPGVRYMDAGALYEGLLDGDSRVEDDFSIFLLEVPLNLRVRFNAPAVTPFLTAGPILRFPLGVEELIEDDLNSISVAGGLGAGLEIPMGGFVLLPEIVITFGLSRFIDREFDIGPVAFSTRDEQRLNTVMLRLGIGLGFFE